MSENSDTSAYKSPRSDGSGQKLFGVPAAIVAAGALIAAAIYFGGGAPSPAADTETADGGSGQAGVAGEEKVPNVPTPPPIGDFRPVDETDHITGAADAKVTIIEYSDTECPFCKRFHPTMQRIVEEYPDDVRWVYRHFPLEALHSQALKEAEALECAGEQGRFWELTDKVYEVTPSNDGLDLETLPELAKQSGVADISKFEQCLESGKYAKAVEEDLADAQAAGGRGTPYSLIIDPDGEARPLSGAQPYGAVKAAVEESLE